MTNQPKLSNRAKQALDVLADGGHFVHRLERNSYTGREQFEYRLMPAGARWNGALKGFGHSTFHELSKAGMMMLADGGTSVSTYYKLNTIRAA